MWWRHRIKRLKTKAKHLSNYFKTLAKANAIERQTDLAHCQHPVLLLYGFGATRRSLSILESRLRKDGFDVFSINLGGFMELFNTDPIDGVAKKVADKIEKLCQRYRLPRLSVIGYSKGGLIGRYYVNCLGGSKRVHTLITLASPHQGNPWVLMAHLLGLGFLSKGLRQMLPSSRFIKHLNRTPHADGVYMVSIASAKDKNCPPKYCQLPFSGNCKPVYNVTLPHLTHSDFVMKPSAYQEILKHLREGRSSSSQSGAGNTPPPPQTTAKC